MTTMDTGLDMKEGISRLQSCDVTQYPHCIVTTYSAIRKSVVVNEYC